MNLITISAAVLAAIIGGLSVMNTMLMSVSRGKGSFIYMNMLLCDAASTIYS